MKNFDSTRLRPTRNTQKLSPTDTNARHGPQGCNKSFMINRSRNKSEIFLWNKKEAILNRNNHTVVILEKLDDSFDGRVTLEHGNGLFSHRQNSKRPLDGTHRRQKRSITYAHRNTTETGLQNSRRRCCRRRRRKSRQWKCVRGHRCNESLHSPLVLSFSLSSSSSPSSSFAALLCGNNKTKNREASLAGLASV